MRGCAEEIGDEMESAFESFEEVGFEHHVVVEKTSVRGAGSADTHVDGGGERERVIDSDDINEGVCELMGVVTGSVVDDDDLSDQTHADLREQCFKEFAALAGGDDYRDARGELGDGFAAERFGVERLAAAGKAKVSGPFEREGMPESPKKSVEASTCAGLVAVEIFGAPEEVTEDLRNAAQVEREVAVVFVIEIDSSGSDFEAEPTHVPVRLFGLEEDAIEADRLACDVPEDALAVDLEVFEGVPGDPVTRDRGLKFRNDVDGDIDAAHLLDFFNELVDQVFRAGGKSEFDLR